MKFAVEGRGGEIPQISSKSLIRRKSLIIQKRIFMSSCFHKAAKEMREIGTRKSFP